jgi:hypothetical protein
VSSRGGSSCVHFSLISRFLSFAKGFESAPFSSMSLISRGDVENQRSTYEPQHGSSPIPSIRFLRSTMGLRGAEARADHRFRRVRLLDSGGLERRSRWTEGVSGGVPSAGAGSPVLRLQDFVARGSLGAGPGNTLTFDDDVVDVARVVRPDSATDPRPASRRASASAWAWRPPRRSRPAREESPKE